MRFITFLMRPKILFLTLRIFSSTGGIEKVCRIICRALFDDFEETNRYNYKVLSAYDRPSDRQSVYVPKEKYKGFAGSRFKFLIQSFLEVAKNDILVLSHINLALPALLIKKKKPKVRIVLFAHGIEIWRHQRVWKKKLLEKCDIILAVSEYTKKQMIEQHQIPADKIIVLNNCIDPFFDIPEKFEKPVHLLHKHELKAKQPVLFALTRMSSAEKYKGYDKVIAALPQLKKSYPEIIYLLGGKYDELEKQRLITLASFLKVEKHIRFIGFVADHELTDYFLLADVFCLPSKKEGFGIAFIEAMACGLPVVAGNRDGSVDALANGKLGNPVDPDNIDGISRIIQYYLENSAMDKKALSDACLSHFNYNNYKQNLMQIFA